MPSKLRKIVELVKDPVHATVARAARAVGLIDFPVPPRSGMHKTSSRTVLHYYASGIRCVMPMLTACESHGLTLARGTKVLDFGCGVGRQLLHFVRHRPDAAYSACDVDDTSVAYIRRTFPQVRADATQYTPPLPYGPGEFDLVYSVSTFSHMALPDQEAWLRELARVTKPGGLCLLTTEGRTALRALAPALGADVATLEGRLRAEGLLFKPYDDWESLVRGQGFLRRVSPLVGIDRAYGHTVIAPEYIRARWPAAGFEVLDVVEGIIDFRQDLVVLRRTATA